MYAPGGEGGWAYNMGILDLEGKVMEAIHAFGFEREDFKGSQIAKIYEPQSVRVQEGDRALLPESVRVLFFDGHLEERRVEWEESQCVATGRVEGTQMWVRVPILPAQEALEENNLLQDANWDAGLVHWQVDNQGAQTYISPEFSAPFPAAPVNVLCVEAEKNFSFCISQKVTPALSGRYCLSVEFCGTDTTGVEVRLFASYDGGQRELIIHPDEQGFTTYELQELPYEKDSVTVGIRISAPPMRCRMRGFSLRRMKDERTV